MSEQAFLAIPKKKADKIDWIKPLSNFISNEYGQQMLETHRVALNDLQQLRENVRNSKDFSESARSDLVKYVGLMSSVMMRFPVSEDNVRINFTWDDIFKHKRNSSYTIFYEQACVLFNVAAVYSHLGAEQNLAIGEGLKAAAGYFQKSAGVLESLRRDTETHPQSAEDLRGDALSMLIALLLAQAQECFFLKAQLSKMNPAILAKLAQGVSDMYDRACLQMESASLKSLVDWQWPLQTRAKAMLYQSKVLVMLAQRACDDKQFGQQVGLLRSAAIQLADINKRNLLKRAKQSMASTMYKEMTQEVNALLKAAEHDNDLIYNDPVPDALPSTEGKEMVKPVAFVNDSSVADPFAQLVPFAVRHAAAIYNDRRQAKLNPVMQATDEHNDLLKGTLASLSLPGALDALDNPRSVPESLAHRANDVRQRGGVQTLFSLLERRDDLAKRNRQLLTSAISGLDDEEARDKAAASGMRTPSHTLNAQLRQEAAKYMSNSEHAGKSDALVQKKVEENNEYLIMLSGPADALERALPAASGATEGVDVAAVNELRKLLARLDALVERRQVARQKLLEQSAQDDITTQLALGGDFEAVYARELSKYDEKIDILNHTYNEQNQLLQDLSRANDRFRSSRSGATGGAREQMLQKLDLAARSFAELQSNLEEGIRFHTSFQTLLQQFKTKCDQFINARDAELAQMSAQAVPTYQQSYQQPYQQQQQHQQQYQQPQQYQQQPPQYAAPNYGQGVIGYQPPPPGYQSGNPPPYGM